MQEQLKKIAILVRDELDLRYFDSDIDYPRGYCGNVSTVLLLVLQKLEITQFELIFAQRSKFYPYETHDKDWTSHSWLEGDGLVIDATQDQFAKCYKPIYIGERQPFHDLFTKQDSYLDTGEIVNELLSAVVEKLDKVGIDR